MPPTRIPQPENCWPFCTLKRITEVNNEFLFPRFKYLFTNRLIISIGKDIYIIDESNPRSASIDGNWHDIVSSLKVAPGHTLRVCKELNFLVCIFSNSKFNWYYRTNICIEKYRVHAKNSKAMYHGSELDLKTMY